MGGRRRFRPLFLAPVAPILLVSDSSSLLLSLFPLVFLSRSSKALRHPRVRSDVFGFGSPENRGGGVDVWLSLANRGGGGLDLGQIWIRRRVSLSSSTSSVCLLGAGESTARLKAVLRSRSGRVAVFLLLLRCSLVVFLLSQPVLLSGARRSNYSFQARLVRYRFSVVVAHARRSVVGLVNHGCSSRWRRVRSLQVSGDRSWASL